MMPSLCAICCRVSRGFGFKRPEKRVDYLGCRVVTPLSLDNRVKHFCSKECQDIFYELTIRGKCVNKRDIEIQAEQSVLGPLGDYVAAIGLQRPLSDYSKEQITGLVSTILAHYHTTLQALTKDEIPF